AGGSFLGLPPDRRQTAGGIMRKLTTKLALAGFMLGAAAMPFTAPAQAENVLRFSNVGDASTLDPHALNALITLMIDIQMYDALVMRDPSMAKIPGLATSWKNLDPNTWEFKLREGVTFHNGSADRKSTR